MLFVNPRSGDGKAARAGLAERARDKGIEAVILAPGQDLAALARDAVTGGADALGMAGGDGSLAVVRAKTKTAVKDKLKAKHAELAAGVRTPVNYTVQQCVEDWLASLKTQAQTTVVGYQIAADHMIELLGGIKLANLKAHDV